MRDFAISTPPGDARGRAHLDHPAVNSDGTTSAIPAPATSGFPAGDAGGGGQQPESSGLIPRGREGDERHTDSDPGGEAVPGVRRLLIKSIKVGDRHRRDLGDIRSLAESMDRNGQFHPILVTEDGELVAGERRLRAARRLGWEYIEARTIDVDDPVGCEAAENIERKEFTISEQVAIAKTIEGRLGERRGRHRTKCQNFDGDRTITRADDYAAKRAGFGNRQTYRQAKAVVDTGIRELVEAMDVHELSIFAASQIAKQETRVQLEQLEEGPTSLYRAGEERGPRPHSEG